MTQERKLDGLAFSLLLILLFLSCKRELSCEGCAENNKPPLAVAGPDTLLTLPTDSVLLDGSRSSDPDGTINEWQWTKVSGPASFAISNSAVAKTTVKNLKAGVYQFELKVTDDKGDSARDTVQVMVANPSANQPPIANAGADTIITLPTNSVTLDGSKSADPDGNITAYQWTKVEGPTSFSIANANAVQTQVNSLEEGIYQFELKVTDQGGLFDKDTVQITVKTLATTTLCGDSNRTKVNAQLIPVGTLSVPRDAMSVASAGGKLLFAGGYDATQNHTSRIDIWDLNTNTWSTAELSRARTGMATITAGNQIFFAGGEVGDGTSSTTNVDIYDAAANSWSTNQLSACGDGIAAATVDNKVLFAGGEQDFCTGGSQRGKRVDVYDLTNGTWSATDALSVAKDGATAVTVGNKVYIAAGGRGQNDVDIYDNTTDTWSLSTMTESKGSSYAGIGVDNKIYWAGGYLANDTYSCQVEIWDLATGQRQIRSLSGPGSFSVNIGQNAVVRNGKIIFFSSFTTRSKRFDIYDIATDSWVIGLLPVSVKMASIISVNNTIYIAGGYIDGVLSNQVWKMEF